MLANLKTHFSSLGLLRQGLVLMALATMLVPMLKWLTVLTLGEIADSSLLSISAGLIAPVMAPILIVVLLLDYLMAKVRVADDPEGAGAAYKAVVRLQLILMLLMLAFWIPFFVTLVP